ncbi:hypothetical protein [Haladaptatus sp. NG-WS-4]
MLSESTIALGYFPLMVVGSMLFSVRLSGVALAPDVLLSSFVGGLVYPVAFGALGALHARRGTEASEPVRTFGEE